MSTPIKPTYTSNANAITITLASLGSGSTVFSSVISNTTDLDLDKQIGGFVKTGASGVSGTGTVSLIVAASVDGGTTYPTDPNACKLLSVIPAIANATTYVFDLQSVAVLYGGILPEKFKIGVINNSGATFDSTAGNHAMYYAREALGT